MVGTSNESVPEMASDPSIFEHHFECEQVLKNHQRNEIYFVQWLVWFPLQRTPTLGSSDWFALLTVETFWSFLQYGAPGR